MDSATWMYWVHITFILCYAFFGSFLILASFPFRPFDSRNASLFFRIWIKLSKFLGIRYRVIGLENIRNTGGGLILLNHQSVWDMVVNGHFWDHVTPISMITKRENLYLGPMGLAGWSAGSTFIDRTRGRAALNTIEQATKAIHEKGVKFLICPEGTRSIAKDQLLPFKNGAFISAMQNKCMIYPVVASKFTFLDHKRKRFTPGVGTISVMTPINSKEFDSVEELRDYCQRVMQEEYDRVNAME